MKARLKSRSKYAVSSVLDFERMFQAKLPREQYDKLVKHARGLRTEASQLEYYKVILAHLKGESSTTSSYIDWRTKPVEFETFLHDKFYFGVDRSVFFPGVYEALMEINNNIHRGTTDPSFEPYNEIVLTGGIGVGKTTIPLYCLAYQLYILSCYRNPHRALHVDPSNEILIIFQSIKEKTAEKVDFARFRSMIHASPYFTYEFPYDPAIETFLSFPNNISASPVSSLSTATIGANVFGALIDEINHIQRRSVSSTTEDASVDPSVQMYSSMARRRESRFMYGGRTAGLLCIAGSKMYPGQVTDIKTEEAAAQLRNRGKTTIFVYDKALWDVAPEGRFTKGNFKLFLGDSGRNPRIVSDEDMHAFEHDEREGLVVSIPNEYLDAFESNIFEAMREIAGRSTRARNPFIHDVVSLTGAFGRRKSIFATEAVDLDLDTAKVIVSRFENPSIERYVHVDIGLTQCSLGLAIGHIPRFQHTRLGDTDEVMPEVHIDGMLEVLPPRNSEIKIHLIRELIYNLIELGLNIRWVTMDAFQSRESLQVMAQRGLKTGVLSVQKTSVPYDFVKNSMYRGRLFMPKHKVCLDELKQLMYDQKTRKVDHPPGGTKDVSDALAGCVYGLTTRAEIWAKHGYSLGMIPESIRNQTINNITAPIKVDKTPDVG